MLGAADVPDDGQRFAVIGWKQWSDLLSLPEFANAEFVGRDNLPWRNTQAKYWLGTLWVPHTGLPLTGEDQVSRTCFVPQERHRSRRGARSQNRHHMAWRPCRSLRLQLHVAGSALIDPMGVVKMLCNGELNDGL